MSQHDGQDSTSLLEKKSSLEYVPVAQLDRVFDYESKGRGFESPRARQNSPIDTGLSGFSFIGILFICAKCAILVPL